MGARRDLRSASQPRRSGRIQKAATSATSAQTFNIEDNNRVTKPEPKPKQRQQKYDCSTCGRTLAGSGFPKYLPTDTCKSHLINTCKPCLKQWIAVQLESTSYDNIACPECPELMKNSDIQLHASADIYNKFDNLERRDIADKTPGWRWCLAPRCKAGQVHKAPVQTHSSIAGLGPLRRTARNVKKPKGFEPKPNICKCKECGAEACVECDRPWHKGETCEEYQKRLTTQHFEKEEAASLKTIEKECKQCPSCKKNFQRNGGCDHIRCTQCGSTFCFLCLRLYNDINRDGHGPQCVYSRPGRIDPHAGAGPAVVAGVLVGAGALMVGAAFLR